MLVRVAFAFNVASGAWARQELPGPPSFEVWLRRWNVFKTAMRLPRGSQYEPLDMCEAASGTAKPLGILFDLVRPWGS
eukprot:11612990-Alexandrium_andersonii.AAC.1